MYQQGGVYVPPGGGSGGTPVLGSGTLNYVTKWTPDGATIGDSDIFNSGGLVGVGVNTGLVAKFGIISTGEQFRSGYDASNYFSITTSSVGVSTFNAVGTSPYFYFSDSIGILVAPTASIHIKGSSSTSATYTLKADNSLGNPIIYGRDDQNVGIGITPGTYRLHVDGTSSLDFIRISKSNTAQSYIGYDSTGGAIILVNSNNSANLVSINCPTVNADDYINTGRKLLIGTNGAWGGGVGKVQLEATTPYNFYLVTTGNVAQAFFGYNDVGGMLVLQNAAGASALFSINSNVVGSYDFHNTGRTMIYGSNTTSISASALVDFQSTTKGIVIPRMTATQASAITAVEGLMLHSTNTNGTFTSIGIWYYENGAWVKL